MRRVGHALAWVLLLEPGCADEAVLAVQAVDAAPNQSAPVVLQTTPQSPELANAEDDDLEGPVSVTVVEPGEEPKRPVALAGISSPWTVSLVTTVHEPVEAQPGAVPLRLVVLLGPAEEGAAEVPIRMQTVELLGVAGEQATVDRALRDGLRKIARMGGVLSIPAGGMRLESPDAKASDHWVVQGAVRTLRRGLRWTVAPPIEKPLGMGARWDADVAGPAEGDEPIGGAHYTIVSGPEDGMTSLRIVPWRAGEETTTAMHLSEGVLASPSDRFQLRGSAIQGGIVAGQAVEGTEVYFRGRRLSVSERGEFLVPFGRNARPPAHLILRFPDGTRSEHVFFVEQREYETEAIDGLPDEMVNPSREVLAELNRVNRRIDRVRQTVSDQPLSLDEFQWPAKGKVTSTYGRKRILNGVPKGYHWGVDIAAPIGRLVRAPAPGVVVFAEQNVPLSGNIVILDHGQGLTSSFLHLDRIRVKVGDAVSRGDVVGKVGNTGRATGPHLDWRMNVMDVRVDPGLLVDGEP